MDHKCDPWGSKLDLHQVTLQPGAKLVHLPRVGFKAPRKVFRGKFERRQMSMDTGLLSIIGAKCPNHSFSSDLITSQSFSLTSPPLPPAISLPSKPSHISLSRSKTSISVVTFPSSSQTYQLRKVLGDRVITAQPGGKPDLIVPRESTPDMRPTPIHKPLEEPAFSLHPLSRPAHVHTVEVKFRPSKNRLPTRGKDQISAILTVVRAQSAEKSRLGFSLVQKPID